VKIKIKKLSPDAKVPMYGTPGSAAVDIYSVGDYYIFPGSVGLLQTGIALEIPEGYYVELFNRSGLAWKRELIILSSRVIDSDYRGELYIPVKLLAAAVTKTPDECLHIKKGERIAQMMVKKVIPITFEETETLSNTLRGTGGFGSTGK